MVSIELRIRKLIGPARQADDLAILFHAADGCGGHAGGPEFCKAQNPARREQIEGYFALGPGLRHRYILSHFHIHSERFCLTWRNKGTDKRGCCTGGLEATEPLRGSVWNRRAKPRRGRPAHAAEPVGSASRFDGDTPRPGKEWTSGVL